MKISVRVTKQDAANWVEETVEIAKPVEQWSENDLHELCDKMQWFIGGNNPVRTCEPIGDGFGVAIAVDGRAVETIEPLPLSGKLAASNFWSKIHEGAPAPVRCPDCDGELTANKRFTFWSRTLGEPEMRIPFWSTTCGACGHRFNYSPGSGEVRRFEP